jgi:hypothetical protein
VCVCDVHVCVVCIHVAQVCDVHMCTHDMHCVYMSANVCCVQMDVLCNVHLSGVHMCLCMCVHVCCECVCVAHVQVWSSMCVYVHD